jgi:hypothetical protein
MFSAVKFLQRTCRVSFRERRLDGRLRPFDGNEFKSAVPTGWMIFLNTGREAVISKFQGNRCRTSRSVFSLPSGGTKARAGGGESPARSASSQ